MTSPCDDLRRSSLALDSISKILSRRIVSFCGSLFKYSLEGSGASYSTSVGEIDDEVSH